MTALHVGQKHLNFIESNFLSHWYLWQWYFIDGINRLNQN